MIVGISGHKTSGKDTVGKIIQYLMFKEKLRKKNSNDKCSFKNFSDWSESTRSVQSGWQTKQFAGKLKQIICLLISCSMEDLENNEFKEKELGEEWNKFKVYDKTHGLSVSNYFSTIEETSAKLSYIRKYDKDIELRTAEFEIETYKLTPRKLLQLVGTDAMRNLVHPEIWVNSLMAEIDKENKGNFIISDTRFTNEILAIEKRKGIIIRIEREGLNSTDLHESETQLDNYPFKYIIDNSGDFDELITKTKNILQKINLL